MQWSAEITELHEVFETYFLGTTDSLDRVDAVLADEFSIVGPDGNESDREQTMQMLLAGHNHTDSLVITTSDHQLITKRAETLVATYIEHHELSDRSNHRRATVVFVPNPDTPNGVQWLRVHETWVD